MRPFHSWRRFAMAPTSLLAVTLAVGCMDDAKITAPDLSDDFPEHPGWVSPGASLAPGAAIHEAARGSGHLPIEGPQKIRIFTFEAAKGLDSTVSGSFELRRAPGGVRIGGEVACLELIPGNEAWIGGIVRSVTDPGNDFIVGWTVVFHALDTGEAPGAGPDQITLIQFFEDPAAATAFCEQRDGIEGYDLALMDIAAGNVQVGRVGPADITWQREPKVMVMNADGSGQSVVALDGDDPTWSPDGRRIAFNSDRDGDHEIYLIDPDGGDLVQITHNEGHGDERPAWSPDGRWIAFMSDRDGDNEIYVMRPDGSGVTQLTFNEEPDGNPNWRR